MKLFKPPPQAGDRTAESLLARAAVFRLIARGFAYPGEGHAVAMRADCRRLLPKSSPSRPETLPARVTARLRLAARSWAGATAADLAPEYLRLFHGAGPLQLYETAYGDGRRLGGRSVEMADISGFYKAFGLEAAGPDRNRADHLGAELEFLSLLLVKEAYALTQGWRSRRAVTMAAIGAFLDYHLGRWIAPLCRAIRASDAPPLYRQMAALLETAVTEECRLRRLHPTATEAVPARDAMQDESFSCPRAEAGAATE